MQAGLQHTLLVLQLDNLFYILISQRHKDIYNMSSPVVHRMLATVCKRDNWYNNK